MQKILILIIASGLTVNEIKVFSQEKTTSLFIQQISTQTIDSIALANYFYNLESKVYYKVVYDKMSLGLILKLDKAALGSLLGMGLEIWLNPENKRKKINGVRYPMAHMYNFDMDLSEEQKIGSMKNPQLALQSSEMEIVGFGFAKDQIIAADNSNNIHGQISIVDNDLVLYQIIIPFKKMDGIIDLEKPFNFVIKSGNFEGPVNSSRHLGMQPGAGMGGRNMLPPENQQFGDAHNQPIHGENGEGNNTKPQKIDLVIKNISILNPN